MTTNFIPAERFAALQSFSEEEAGTLQKTIDIKTFHLEWKQIFPGFKGRINSFSACLIVFLQEGEGSMNVHPRGRDRGTPFVYKHNSSKY